MKTDMLQVQGLSVRFRGQDGQPVQAVWNVSFSIARGETLGLVGESGCGKSSVARAIMQLPRPASGRILFRGRNTARVDLTGLNGKTLRRLRPRFQMIFQDVVSSLNPRRSVMDTLTAPLKVIGIAGRRERERRAGNMLASVGLDPRHLHLRPFQLSGGQCQRIQIARALITDPELLICDEPVSSLDVSVQAQVINLLEDLRTSRGLTMLFISHDLAVVKNVCDRVVVMHLGKLCEEAPSERLYRAHYHPCTRALFDAVPRPDPDFLPGREDLIEGEQPSPLAPPSGCRFRTRCPRADTLCAREEPGFCDVEPGHRVACHFPIRSSFGQPARPEKDPSASFESLAEKILGTGFPPPPGRGPFPCPSCHPTPGGLFCVFWG